MLLYKTMHCITHEYIISTAINDEYNEYSQNTHIQHTMATNETTPVKNIPSYMRGTATSSTRVTPEKEKLPTQPQSTSYQPLMSVPKSPARKIPKVVTSSRNHSTLHPLIPPQSNRLPHKLELVRNEILSNINLS